MENYIALLLLVVPGFVAVNICNKLDENKRAKDKFEVTINALIYNVFVMFLVYIYLIYFCSASTDINVIRDLFGNIQFIINYICIFIVSIICVVIAWHFFLKKGYAIIVNKGREIEGKDSIFEENIYQKVFGDGQSHWVLVEQDGKEVAKGYAQYVCEEDKNDIYIDNIELIKDLNTYRPELLSKIKGVYYDFNTKVKITEYEYDIN